MLSKSYIAAQSIRLDIPSCRSQQAIVAGSGKWQGPVSYPQTQAEERMSGVPVPVARSQRSSGMRLRRRPDKRLQAQLAPALGAVALHILTGLEIPKRHAIPFVVPY